MMTEKTKAKPQNGKVIVLDVDGVLLSFTSAFDMAAEICLGKKPVKNEEDNSPMSHYNLCKRLNITNDEVDRVLQFMQDSGMYAELKALEGAKEAVEKIKMAGFKIIICTALPESAKEMRLFNLQEAIGLVPDESYFVGMGMSKKDALAKIRPDVYVDDRINYLREAIFVEHLVWCDQREIQDDHDSQVTTHVHSLLEWTKNFMPAVVKQLDAYYDKQQPIQMGFKLESAKIRHRP